MTRWTVLTRLNTWPSGGHPFRLCHDGKPTDYGQSTKRQAERCAALLNERDPDNQRSAQYLDAPDGTHPWAL